MKNLKIKTGDTVRVIAGDHKGSEGKILKLFKSKEKAIVEGVNVSSVTQSRMRKTLKAVS